MCCQMSNISSIYHEEYLTGQRKQNQGLLYQPWPQEQLPILEPGVTEYKEQPVSIAEVGGEVLGNRGISSGTSEGSPFQYFISDHVGLNAEADSLPADFNFQVLAARDHVFYIIAR